MIFTDSSCKNSSMVAGVFFAEGSQCNHTFQVGAELVSMVAELHTIEEALLCSPARVNVCIATNSKSSIEVIQGWRSSPLSKCPLSKCTNSLGMGSYTTWMLTQGSVTW
jgi:hypothetical protein